MSRHITDLRSSLKLRLSAAAAVAVLTAAIPVGGPALASGDYGFTPVFSLLQSDGENTLPFLAPTNDSRISLLLLMNDAGMARPHAPAPLNADAKPGPYDAQTPLDFDNFVSVFTDLPDKPAAASDAVDPAAEFVTGEGDICRSNSDGNDGFQAALKTSKIPQAEQAVLGDARLAVAGACGPDALTAGKIADGAIRSGPGKDFAGYLAAAALFYGDDFTGARQGFAGLAKTRQPWLKEAAAYMVARADLNAAQAKAFGDYGELSLKDVDARTLAAADSEFQAYLHDYPHGAYAASARGLRRRVAWLAGDHARLADAYGAAFSNSDADLRNVSAVDLAYEIDNKLLGDVQPGDIHEPRLLATLDLMEMRQPDAKTQPKLSRADLEAQRPVFATQKALYDYLLAAYAFYDENDAGTALKVLGTTAPGPHMNNVEFSRQVLKGLALEATHKATEARAQWLALIPGAEPVMQRPAIELALAENYEQAGDIGPVFAANSPIKSPTYREMLLSRTAGPDLLRQRATAGDAVPHERALAIYTLLFKELNRGRYQAFLDDLHLAPAAPGATNYAYDKLNIGQETLPALADFTWAGTGPTDDFACPSLRSIATALAHNPHAERSLICLGEFLRINNYDGMFGAGPAAGQLASAKPQFPGKDVSRLDIYKSIIADTKTEPDVRAYALYRAINCWAPSAYNGCDATDAPVSQRKAWFQTLKTQYKTTAWAANLKYYW